MADNTGGLTHQLVEQTNRLTTKREELARLREAAAAKSEEIAQKVVDGDATYEESYQEYKLLKPQLVGAERAHAEAQEKCIRLLKERIDSSDETAQHTLREVQGSANVVQEQRKLRYEETITNGFKRVEQRLRSKHAKGKINDKELHDVLVRMYKHAITAADARRAAAKITRTVAKRKLDSLNTEVSL